MNDESDDRERERKKQRRQRSGRIVAEGLRKTGGSWITMQAQMRGQTQKGDSSSLRGDQTNWRGRRATVQ